MITLKKTPEGPADPNQVCLHCDNNVEATHVILWLGAFICAECKDQILDGFNSESEHISEKVRIKRIVDAQNNSIAGKFLELGGNQFLKQYMKKHRIRKIDLNNKKIRAYQEQLIVDVFEKININNVPYSLDNIIEILLAIYNLLFYIKDQHLVIVVGSLGSDKTTMIQSLVSGTEKVKFYLNEK